MEKKALLRLMAILLGFSYVVFAVAVPATRSPKARELDSSEHDHLAKKDLELRNSEEVFDMEEGYHVEGRMMLIKDYSGARANPAHDPKNPGKP